MICTRLLATMAIFAVLLTAVWALGDVMTKHNADAQMMGAMGMGSMTSGGMMTMKPSDNMMMADGKNITSSINLMNIIGQAIGSKVNVSLSEAATIAEGSIGMIGPGMMMGGERNMTRGPGMMMGGPQQGRGMMMGPMNQGMMMGGERNMTMGPGMMMGPRMMGQDNNSRAVAAYLGEENGYLVYNVMVIDPSMNFSKVIVDPGNGHLLFSKQLSKEDMMKDEMERHHKMMSMMMGGPQQGQGMMMGQGPGQGMMMGQGPGPGQGMMMRGERNMTMGPGMMMGGPQQGRGMMMGPMTAQAQQTDNITSSNATSVLPTTNTTANATSPAAVVSTSEPSATTVSMARGSQSPNNPEFYVPTKITVKPGEIVTWKNDDTAIHTATSGQDVTPDDKFDTSYVPPGQSSKPIAMPTQPGEYSYFCTLHPWMIGSVTVA